MHSHGCWPVYSSSCASTFTTIISGFSKNSLAQAECNLVKRICHLLGVTVDEKTQWGDRLNVFGITYSFSEERLLILRERKEALIQEILEILSRGSLTPGEAAKLHGKLGFVSGHLSVRHGRSCLLALSERQNARNGSSTVTLTIRRPTIVAHFTGLISRLAAALRFRTLTLQIFWCSPMAVILTLGQAPRGPRVLPGLGGCVSRSGSRTSGGVHLFLVHAPEYVISEWLSRRTQIMMIELLRAVIAVEQMSEKMEGKRITLFIDSETAEAALIKGYSARSDINDLAGYMWDPVAKRDMGFFVARVPTDGNPSDGSSRADFSELERRGGGFTSQPYSYQRTSG